MGVEFQAEQAAEARSQKDTKEKARGDTKKGKLGNRHPGAVPAVPDVGLEHLLEQLSLLDLTQRAGTEALLVVHSPQAAQLGWHGHPPLRPSIGAAGELLWPQMRFGH